MKKAIIIEDDFIIGLYLRKQLEKSNINVVDTIDRGEDLAESVRKHRPDILLIDIALNGEKDGINAVEELPANQKPALIFITGASTKQLNDRIWKLNPLGFLSKPVDIDAFNKLLEKIDD